MKPSIVHLASRQPRLWFAALTAVLLGTAAVSAQTGAAGSTTPRASSEQSADKLDRTDRKFIEKAAKSNHKEMALSELAAQRATNQEVRSFAQQIVSDHSNASQQLMQLAHSKGVMLEDMSAMHGSTMSSTTGASTRAGGTTAAGTKTGTTGTTDTQRAESRVASVDDRDVKKLSDESGRDFDERYVKLMVKEHEDAVKLFEETAKDAKDPEIRSYASQQVGALRQHLQQAKNLERAVAE